MLKGRLAVLVSEMVQFISVYLKGVSSLSGNIYMRSNTSLGSFPAFAFETVTVLV